MKLLGSFLMAVVLAAKEEMVCSNMYNHLKPTKLLILLTVGIFFLKFPRSKSPVFTDMVYDFDIRNNLQYTGTLSKLF